MIFDLVTSASTTTLMNENSKNELLEKQTSALQPHPLSLRLWFRVHIASIWLWDICLALHLHLVFTLWWAGLYITGRNQNVSGMWTCVFTLLHATDSKSGSRFVLSDPVFIRLLLVCILPLPIVISLVLPPACIDNIFLNHVFLHQGNTD